MFKSISSDQREQFNAVVSHPLQSFEWGEFREKTGIKVIRRGFFDGEKLKSGFQLTIHPIPHSPWNIGYLPKGEMPNQTLIGELQKIGKEENCIFIQLEPNVIISSRTELVSEHQGMLKQVQHDISKLGLKPAAHPLFTKYTFVLDLTQSEEDILKNMHSKARYNIRVAQKHNVEIVEDDSNNAFEEYLKLTNETTTRQGFYAHTEKYHRLMWETLKACRKWRVANSLSAHLFTAIYKPPATSHEPRADKILVTWIVFVFKDTLYYPYGASSSEHREVMASNLMMWEVIRFGKKLGLKKFDMWGALGPDPDTKDPWYGFHNFKQKYGPEHVEFIGSYDLVINPMLYQVYKIADKLRWLLLKLKR